MNEGGTSLAGAVFKDLVFKNTRNLKAFLKKYLIFNLFPPMNEGETSLAGAVFKDLVSQKIGNKESAPKLRGKCGG